VDKNLTAIIGASDNPSRASFRAAQLLSKISENWVPVGRKESVLFSKTILPIKSLPAINGVHTVTIYLSAENQKEYYDYILSLEPVRIIFNPGAENPELANLAREKGIKVENACTLVMLSIGNYALD
jgi:uncharacterized protein